MNSEWKHAEEHCWRHVESASELQKVVKALCVLEVEGVIPVVSTIGPSIIITPHHHGDRDALRKFTEEVFLILVEAGMVDETTAWTTHLSGDHWAVRIKTKTNIAIDIATSIPRAVTNEFSL